MPAIRATLLTPLALDHVYSLRRCQNPALSALSQPPMAYPSPARAWRALDGHALARGLGGLALIGLVIPHFVLWLPMRIGHALVAIALGVAIGWLADRRWPDLARALGAGAALVWTLDPLRGWVDTLGGPAPYGTAEQHARLALDTARVLLGLAAAAAAAAGPRGLPLAAGAIVLTPVGRCDETMGLATSLIALAATLGRCSRDRPALDPEALTAGVALGILGGLSVLGLCEDLAATAAPSDLHETMRSWTPDPANERALRMALEVATALSVAAFARGRPWDAPALVLAAGGLAIVSWAFRGPTWGSGCVGHLHTLSGSPQLLLLPTLVVIGPWLVPRGAISS